MTPEHVEWWVVVLVGWKNQAIIHQADEFGFVGKTLSLTSPDGSILPSGDGSNDMREH
ncbi:MAG: hypothetical protein ABI557_10845 [Aureliella sp.]